MAKGRTDRIGVENANRLGAVRQVDAQKYEAMKRAFLRVLPKKAPGLTEAEISPRVVEFLPETVFPGGARAGWWQKTVQLDLEAKGAVAREKTRPLRWHKT